MIAKGLCPLEERLKRKSAPPFRDFVEESYMGWAKAHKKSWRDDDRMLKLDWLPLFGTCPIERDIQARCSRQYHEDSAAVFRGHQ